MAHNWHTSNRRSRLPKNWPQLRTQALTRDCYKCRAVNEDGTPCIEAATDVDHIEPGDNHALENLQSLCAWHHKRKTANEAAAARPQYAPRKRPAEKHPGSL
jgi:5-methylcytosine-specific restriction endonuclease McrA